MDSITLKINIIRARRNNPCATLNEIGIRYNVTREYVRQVLSNERKPTGAYHQTYLCIQCGKDMGVKKKLFCSRQCLSVYSRIKIACTYCGNLGEYSAKELIWRIEHNQHSLERFFCSKTCQGKWLAENYGFGTHPENCGMGGSPRKWDFDKVYELRDETGWGALRISQSLGIQEPTVTAILKKHPLTFKMNG